MNRYQTLLQPSLQTGTMVQKVDVSALATRRNCSFYLFEGMGINSLEDQVQLPIGELGAASPAGCPCAGRWGNVRRSGGGDMADGEDFTAATGQGLVVSTGILG